MDARMFCGKCSSDVAIDTDQSTFHCKKCSGLLYDKRNK